MTQGKSPPGASCRRTSLLPAGTGGDCKKIFLGIFLSHDETVIRYDGLEQKGRDSIQTTSPS